MNQNKINYNYEIILYLLKNRSYGRELALNLNTSLTRIQRILNELQNYNVIDFKTEGRNHVYFLKKNLVSRSYILNAENYKLVKLVKKYSFLEPLFMDIVDRYPQKLMLLFGSYAKFISKKDSDIDFFIETKDPKIKENIKNMYGRLSVKIGQFNQDDLLVKEIIKNHVIIQGGEVFYEKIDFFR